MHLKRIRLYGFKSFAQDTIVDLDPGINALVGPNGGGKSNVVDAIRWVLGEQRLRDLRAERWEDLLNHGGSGRPPARLAEATLEFDNCDGEMADWPESLTISRRYYRSGDSEYLINGRSARLRDVTDLFLDSGLGRFSYAIISQGRVEAALLQKPLERLEQLEEAAGVSRYKVRKRETLGHLKETESKLGRLVDLSDEVGRQIDEVRERADTESRYRNWECWRQEWQARLMLTEYRRAMDRRGQLERQLAHLAEERHVLGEALNLVGSDLETLRDQTAQASTSLEDEAGSLRQLSQQETALAILQAEQEGHLKHLRSERESLQSQMATLTRQQHELEAELVQSARFSPVTQGGAADSSIEDARAAVAAAEMGVAEARRVRDETLGRLSALNTDRHRLDQRLARLQGLLRVDAVGRDLTDIFRSRQTDAANLERRVGELTQELAEYAEERARLRTLAMALDQEISELKHQLAGRQARLRALHQLDQEGAGLSNGVRSVLRSQQEGTLRGVRGTLSSLIHSTPELMMAVETALGGAHQDLVMETEKDARAAVRFLQMGSLGRATFLPLDTVRSARPSGDDYRTLRRETGVLGWASDLVESESAIRSAVQHILGRVLIVQSLDVASRLGRVHQFRYKMVTLDGQVVHAGGAITGGSRNPGQTQQSRRMEEDELTRRIREDSEGMAAKEKLLESTRQEGENIAQRVDAARDLLADVRHQRERLVEAWASAGGLGDPEELTQQLSRLSESQAEQERALAEAGRVLEDAEGSLATAREGLARLEQMASDAARAQRDHEVIAGRIAQEIERLSVQEKSYLRRIEIIDAEELEVQPLLARTQAELAEVRQTVSNYERSRAERVQALTALRHKVAELEMRQRVLELEDRKMDQKGSAWKEDRLALSVRFEAYQPPENLEPLSKTEEAHAQREVVRITERLNAMGPVVPGSVALFEQLTERQQFLDKESQDVKVARSELLETLREIDTEMDKRVKDTASQVEHAFSESCRRLYGGGDGGFTWVDGENPGVELWVRPAGKRPSHLGLLSGGEKALGGIAWLFSLLAVRPAPFVVLDEVEASLDEANAGRVARYLAVAGKTRQYVIVTHQRQTMEAADALWGVAGDGHGQSRMVSVRLADVDERVSSSN